MTSSLSYYDILRWREDKVDRFYADHSDQPFPVNTLLVFIGLPVLGLMVPGARTLRLAVFAITAYVGIDIIRHFRTTYGGNGYSTGMIASTWILHVAVHLLLNNPERDYQRLEYTQRQTDHRPVLSLGNGDFVHWQPYPRAALHRLSWVLDLLFSMRGSRWNWRIDSLRPLPSPLQDSVLHPPRPAHSFHTATSNTLTSTLFLLLKSLVIIGVLAFFARRDPYFWGILGTPPLPESPAFVLHRWPLLLRAYRMLVCYAVTVNFLISGGALGHLLGRFMAWVGLSPVPFTQPWLNTPLFGNTGLVMDFGLAGFWGSYWHQIYRFDGLTFSAAVLSYCPSWIRRQVVARRIIRMLVIFFLVGIAHSCACYSSLGPTRPIRGVLTFFMLQAVGILLQMMFLSVLPRSLRRPGIGRIANFVGVFVWFLACAPLLFDEYTSGGLYIIDAPDTVILLESRTLSRLAAHLQHVWVSLAPSA